MRRTALAALALASMLAAACSSAATPTSTPTPTTEATSTAEAASTAVSPQITGTPDEMPPLFYTYETVAGDTLASVAVRFGVSESAVRVNNFPALVGLGDAPPPGTELLIPAVEGVIHRVEQGETLTDIAAHYGVDVEAITSFAPNGLSSPEDAGPGAVVLIPVATEMLDHTPTPVAPLPPAPIRPMTIEVVTEDPAVRDNVGALTIVVGTTECGTIDLSSGRATVVLESGTAPPECIAPGATITFIDANGRTLFEKTAFESGGHFLLTNLVPEPPF